MPRHPPRIEGLTRRERDLVRLVGEGFNDRAIAARLALDRRGISTSLLFLRRKLVPGYDSKLYNARVILARACRQIALELPDEAPAPRSHAGRPPLPQVEEPTLRPGSSISHGREFV